MATTVSSLPAGSISSAQASPESVASKPPHVVSSLVGASSSLHSCQRGTSKSLRAASATWHWKSVSSLPHQLPFIGSSDGSHGRGAARSSRGRSSRSSALIADDFTLTDDDEWADSPSPTSTKDEAEEDEEHDLEPLEPYFYYVGSKSGVKAYGVEFKQGAAKGVGVYASKDINTQKGPKVVMEIPLPVMISVTREPPWMFYPDIVPMGHPIFDVISATDPKNDWDLRLACLLLTAISDSSHLLSEYADYLPPPEDLPSLLLATEAELAELQDESLAEEIRRQQRRAAEFWRLHFGADSADKRLRQLAPSAADFLWAVGASGSRGVLLNTPMGSVDHDTHLMAPYADMLNHSFEACCSFFWRKVDRVLEVRVDPGQKIEAGQELTFSYGQHLSNSALAARYGFTSTNNPWEKLELSGSSRIHRDTFLSTFDIFGTEEEYHQDAGRSENDDFVTGSLLSIARFLPTWHEGDRPILPSEEIAAARQIQGECQDLLARFPTSLAEDELAFGNLDESATRLRIAVKYRMDRKKLLVKLVKALDLYVERIIF